MSNYENRRCKVFLKSGRDKSVRNRHPWIFSGAIDRSEGDIQPGDVASVYSAQKEFLAKGFVNPRSQIFVRILTFEDEAIDEEFFSNRIRLAIRHREQFIANDTDAYRLVNAEGDLLPGLVVDKYAAAIVLQFGSLGMHRLRSVIVSVLEELLNPDIIVERNEGRSLEWEGLEASSQVIWGEAPPLIQIMENGVRLWVDVLAGQKTGFFLDQRENRQRIAELSIGKRLLNCFSYSGGFSVYAALQGAETTSVETSEAAQALAQENFSLNNLDRSKHRFITADVFDFLRTTNDKYDVMVLDPPAFVSKKQHIRKGARGYKDINRLAMKRIADGGLLLSCSCSHYVNWDLFQKILFAAAAEAGRNVQVIGRFGAPPDHPVSIFHPEGEYLKSLLLRVFDG